MNRTTCILLLSSYESPGRPLVQARRTYAALRKVELLIPSPQMPGSALTRRYMLGLSGRLEAMPQDQRACRGVTGATGDE